VSDASKKDRRDHAREIAREQREAEKKRRKRNRIILQGSVILGLIAVITVVTLVFISANRPVVPVPGPANMASDGILLQGDGTGAIVAVPTDPIPVEGTPTPTDLADYSDTVNIVMYIDYLCPICRAFEEANGAQLEQWVSQGVATLEYHPISFLDRFSQGTRYSTRSANAAACVADTAPDSFFIATTALFANQPAENSSGLTNGEIISTLEQVGVTDAEVAECINDGTFLGWVADATERATTGPIPNSDLESITGTPTVIVDGYRYPGAIDNAEEFAAFVSAVATGEYTG
jgi:protein-disulfide isomerase